MVFPTADAAADMMDSDRPVPTMIRSKFTGSIGGYDKASSASFMATTARAGYSPSAPLKKSSSVAD